jgi:hypothetical protein
MPDIDFFDFFRWMLAIVATIYASIVTLQSLWGWYVWLAGSDKYISMARRYLIVHGLRLRFKAFWGDVIVCALLCVVFLLLWRAHTIVAGIARASETSKASAQHGSHVARQS